MPPDATPAAAPAAPAAPATAPAEAAPAATEAATPAQTAADHKRRARDLAGKFLSGDRDTAPAAEAPKAETPPVDAKAEPAKEPDKKPEAKAGEGGEDELEKSWKEVRRRKRQALERTREIETKRAELEQKERVIAARDAERVADERLRDEDPPAWLEKHKFDFREVALREVEKQTLTPEQKAERARAAAEREAREKADKEFREDYANLKKELAEIKGERAQIAQREALIKLHAEVAAEWPLAKSEYPTLAEHYTIEEISEVATKLRLDHYNKTKRDPPFDAIFDHMEANALKAKQRYIRAQVEAGRTERETVGEKSPKTRAKVGPPITNRDSSTKTAPAKPLSDAEKRERSLAIAAQHWGTRQ